MGLSKLTLNCLAKPAAALESRLLSSIRGSRQFKTIYPRTRFWLGQIPGAAGNGRNDGHGHGTHVAGTIVASVGNGIGTAGWPPAVSIIPVKVLSDSGSGSSVGVANGIRWATDNGADIISMSLGGGYSSTIAVQVAYAIQNGVTVIAAAGNERAQGSQRRIRQRFLVSWQSRRPIATTTSPTSRTPDPTLTSVPRSRDLVNPPEQHVRRVEWYLHGNTARFRSRHWCCRGLLNSTWPSRLTCC